MFSIFTENEYHMQKVGEALGELLNPGDIILLEGSLGAGKTTLSKAVAKGLGVEEDVQSPTFTLIREYKTGRLPMYHFDLYRLEDERELERLGYEEYFYGDGVCLIEWADYLDYFLPEEYLLIKISYCPESAESRLMEFVPVGEAYRELVEDLQEYEYSFD